MMISAILTSKGYRVSMKTNTEKIEAAIAELDPDLILMDMLLSGSDGREVCRQLKANPAVSSISLIMLSAYPQAQAECLAAGADDFIEKPFDMKVLLEKVAILIRK